MSESPVGSSAQSTNPIDGSGPSQPSGSPVPSSSPLDNHASDNPTNPSDNPTDEVEVVSEKSDDDDPGKRLRSPYWAHYNRVKIGGVFKAICKYCGAKISGETRNGTSHLKEHYIRKHQKKDNMRQQVLTNNFMNKDRPPLLTSYSFDHETARKELAGAIIMHEYPLSIVDHVGFRRYSNALQPLFKVPCRNTMKAEIFKIYEYQRGKTMSLVVSNASRLAITTDMWTSSNQKKGFMAVTTHFIDDSWTLQSRILRKILDGLRKLHDQGCYHGNLQFGILFSPLDDIQVKFLNFGEASSDLATGIIDDLHQFSLLVKHVISHNPLDKASSHAKQEFPHSYDRFMGHINYLGPALELGLEEVRRQAYFIYNHPLFSSPATNFNMLRKIFSIKRGGYDNFNTYVRLQSMDKWHKSIHKGDLLWNDFKKQKDLYESGPTYLLDFHVNVVKHHKDNNTNARLRGDNEVIQELHRCFPKFASEIYFEYALIFDSTALPPWMLRNDLLLQKDPFKVP